MNNSSNSNQIDSFLTKVTADRQSSACIAVPVTSSELTQKQSWRVHAGFSLSILVSYVMTITRLDSLEVYGALRIVCFCCIGLSFVLLCLTATKTLKKRINLLLTCSLFLIYLVILLLCIKIKANFIEALEQNSALSPSDLSGDKILAFLAQFQADYSKIRTFSIDYNLLTYMAMLYWFLTYIVFDHFSVFSSFLFAAVALAKTHYFLFGIHEVFGEIYNTTYLFIFSFTLTLISIKYYFYCINTNIKQKNAELLKIKQFYNNWIQHLNLKYFLIKDKDIVFLNKEMGNCLDSYFDSCASMDLFQSCLTAYSSLSEGVTAGNTLKNCLKACTFEEKFVKIAAFKLSKEDSLLERDVYFDCVVKNYSEGYTEVFLTDITSLIQEENNQLEEKYKATVFAKIAHEFKTPLNGITLLINTLCEQDNALPLAHFSRDLATMKGLADYVTYLVNDITSYFKGKNSLQILESACKLNDLCKFCFNILECLIEMNGSSGQRVKAVLDNELAKENKVLRIDELRVKQILLNLISNAVKFTKKGFIRLYCRNEGDNLIVGVEDTGHGISKERLRELESHKEMVKVRDEYNQMGSGLGLSICKMLCNKMGFEFNVSTKENEGSNFSLTIPSESEREIQGLNKFESAEIDQTVLYEGGFDPLKISERSYLSIENSKICLTNEIETSQAEFSQSVAFDGRQNFILLAEDNNIIRKALKNVIIKVSNSNNLDCSVLDVSDGVFALSTIVRLNQEGKRVLCLISDEHMDFVNGTDCMNLLKKMMDQGRIRKFKCFSCSNFTEESLRTNMRLSGANMILDKPFNKVGLENAFREAELII